MRQNLRHLEGPDVDLVLILSGDQLYRMNFADMVATHRASKAHVTIAGMPVDRDTAKAMGIMRLDDAGRVAGFLEKPQTHQEMDMVKMDPAWIDARGIPSRGRDLLASMGIYLFNRQTLVDLLTKTDYHDFGREIFPAAVRTHQVQVHLFDGYWEDIGTIRSFYDANLAHGGRRSAVRSGRPAEPDLHPGPVFAPLADRRSHGAPQPDQRRLHDRRRRHDRKQRDRRPLPDRQERDDSQQRADGFRLLTIRRQEMPDCHPGGEPPLGIGDNSVIEGAIIDKNCRIGSGVRVANDRGLETTEETRQAMIADGIIVVQKGAVLPDGWEAEGGRRKDEG